MVQKIRLYGDPVLRDEAAPVGAVDDGVRRLADDLLETMAFADGVGLAAPQIGVSRRIIAVHAPPDAQGVRSAPRVLVDPEIVERGGGEEALEEGCLSIPGVYEVVKRALRIRFHARDLDGNGLDEVAEGIMARIVQHEVDHLDGVLFVDRVGPLRRALLKKRLREFLD